MTVSISVSDTVTLNTCPHYFTLGTNLSEKGTARRPLESCSVSPHWDFRVCAMGHSPPRSRAEDTSPFRKQLSQPHAVRFPGHARLPGTQCRNTEFKISVSAEAASTQGWKAGLKMLGIAFAPRAAPLPWSGPLGTTAPGARLGPVSSCWAGWSHKPGAAFGCMQPYIHMHYLETFAFQGCCYFDLYNPWKK